MPRPTPDHPTPARPLYPVLLDLAGRPCLVVGGGPVAARKAAGLLECGARVTVVARELSPAIVQLAERSGDGWGGGPGGDDGGGGRIELLGRPYQPGEAARYRLVITATGHPDVDGAVCADAERAGVWVNSADDPARCTAQLPSVHRDGPVTVAVSTAGTSPALASWLRRRTADALGPDLATLATLLDEARRRVRASGRSTETLDWEAILRGAFPKLVRAGRLDEARALLAATTSTEPPDRP